MPATAPSPTFTGPPEAKNPAVSAAREIGSTTRYHLSCWRSARSARRQRTATLAAAAPAAASPHATARAWNASNSRAYEAWA
jgi:hypothetical protein